MWIKLEERKLSLFTETRLQSIKFTSTKRFPFFLSANVESSPSCNYGKVES